MKLVTGCTECNTDFIRVYTKCVHLYFTFRPIKEWKWFSLHIFKKHEKRLFSVQFPWFTCTVAKSK